eukprot:TRINITY_DN1428_c0_g1_i2.p1 TRINITY_DN1428_c0_g1~~TRINITY_DN1428_c0_g1_i2.p1  ORF type:complete len:298 (-),score=63.12 TRINITY_DN1428_c0_g1_i2:111-1004(-)
MIHLQQVSANLARASRRSSRSLLPALHLRWVTVWPQWPYDEEEHNAKPVGDPKFRWPPNKPPEPEPGSALTPDEVKETKKKVHRKIWEDMNSCDWSNWERRFWDLKERAIPFDEATYTLLIHGYLLSHRHQSENAYIVLNEMAKAETHPALLKLNERLLNSAFELQELGMRPEASSWRNLTRLCWHSAVRFQKKRQKRLRRELEALDPDDALALEPSDVQLWLRGHDRMALPSPESGIGRFRFLEGPEGAKKRLPAPSHDGQQLRLPASKMSGDQRSRSVGRRSCRWKLRRRSDSEE